MIRIALKRLGFILFSIFTLSGLLVSHFSTTASAVNCDYQFYSDNDFGEWRDPCEATCTTGASAIRGNNQDYAKNPILNDAQMTEIEENKSFYESAATKANIPWQLLAAVHLRETGLRRYGPSNGYGPYQITPSSYRVASSYTDAEFQDASDKAAVFLKDKSGGRDLSNPNNIKYTLFAYNGMAEAYIEQAKRLGFSDAEAAIGEGSPYVMNRADLIRDPTVEPTKSNGTWKQIKTDGGALESVANKDYGAFVVYTAISDIRGCTTGLIAGGMDMQEALAFMETYKTSPDSINYIGRAATNCSGGALANCVSFSAYFINKYTTIQGFVNQAPGHGISVASNMIDRNPGISSGTEPRPYAVFSRPSPNGSAYGHTGVILGVDTVSGKVIVGEAVCDESMDSVTANEYTLAEMSNGKYTYVYTDGLLKEGL